jgi:hypothetical protein
MFPTSKPSVYSNEPTRRYIPEGSNLHTCGSENLKCHVSLRFIINNVSWNLVSFRCTTEVSTLKRSKCFLYIVVFYFHLPLNTFWHSSEVLTRLLRKVDIMCKTMFIPLQNSIKIQLLPSWGCFHVGNTLLLFMALETAFRSMSHLVGEFRAFQ